MRDLVESNIRWVFGRGRVDFWWDRWLFDELVSSYLEFDQPPHFLVAEFYDRDAWNEERLLSWVPMHIVCVIKDVYFQSFVKDELVPLLLRLHGTVYDNAEIFQQRTCCEDPKIFLILYYFILFLRIHFLYFTLLS